MAQEQRPRQSRSLGPDPEATAPPQPALTVPTDVTRNRSARRHPAKAGPHETVAPPGFRSRRPALSPRKRSRMEHSERCARLGPQHHRIGREIERVLVAHLDGDGSPVVQAARTVEPASAIPRPTFARGFAERSLTYAGVSFVSRGRVVVLRVRSLPDGTTYRFLGALPGCTRCRLRSSARCDRPGLRVVHRMPCRPGRGQSMHSRVGDGHAEVRRAALAASEPELYAPEQVREATVGSSRRSGPPGNPLGRDAPSRGRGADRGPRRAPSLRAAVRVQVSRPAADTARKHRERATTQSDRPEGTRNDGDPYPQAR